MRCASKAHAVVRHWYGVKIGLEPITLKTPRVLRAAAPNQQFFARAGLTGLPGPRPRNLAIFEKADGGLHWGWLTLCKPASMQITLRINTSELCENRWVRGSAASGYPGAPHVTHSEPAASFPAPATGQSGPAFVARLALTG